MKSILISIRPEWVERILNGEKTIEVRKSAPRCDLPVEVYIYCTKGGNILYAPNGYNEHYWTQKYGPLKRDLRGKVLAKFMLDEIYEYQIEDKHTWEDPHFEETTQKLMGMGLDELHNYVGDKTFYGWHISDLEIFDEPMELERFEYTNPSGIVTISQRSLWGLPSKKHPPQSWCYVEVKE